MKTMDPRPLPVPLTAPALRRLPGIRHGFFTRTGGCSEGIYAGLNCGPGSRDAPEAVAENRRLAAAALGGEETRLATLYQVHGAECLVIGAGRRLDLRPQADGLVTRETGVILGILTADCVPVLFADGSVPVIGACHAGWKGALGGILEATLTRLIEAGARPERLIAAIGPAIARASYEVGPEFPKPFLAEAAANERYFTPSPRPGHFRFDLPAYVAARLARAGVGEVADLGRDTYAEETFFSYRRATHRGEADYGRQLSAIVLNGSP